VPPGRPNRKIIQFGVFDFDAEAGELRRRGIRVKLQEQPLLVLKLLIEHAGEVVTKEELRRRLWPSDTFVDFDHGVHSAITRLREALSDSSEAAHFIETVPRRGYRFIAPVNVIGSDTGVDPAIERSSSHDGAYRRKFLPAALTGLLVGAFLLGLAGNFNPDGFRRWMRERNSQIRSLAVLPLQNLSGDPAQEYFVDGMTDALITELSRIGTLRVISRTSAMHYKGTKQGLPEIAQELNVDGVVEGSVIRSGNRVRIAVQLIYAGTDQHLWAESYDRDLGDILSLQNEVAQDIAQQVRVRVKTEQQTQTATVRRVNPEAYETYLRGRYFWNQRTEVSLWKSVELFQQAIRIDPDSALPYAGLADAYLVLDSWTVEAAPPVEISPKARMDVEKALELEPTLAEARTVLAGLKHGDWDWSGAGIEYRRAIEINPNYAHAHQWYSQYLCEMGRFDAGVHEADLAHALDPLNLILGVDVGNRLYWSRKYKEAIGPIEKTLELDADFRIAHRFLGQAYEQSGMYETAIAELQRARELSNNNPIDLAALGHVYAVSGQPSRAAEILQELRRLATKRYVSGYDLALVYIGLGNKELAFQSLEKAFQERSAWMLHLKVDPRLDPLRSDPRFQDLLVRVGLSS
jgi:TolB-like protein/DNA-binding winged helix-turn-helix (wHTH) protein/Tfp pilus assembly protein PilF